MANSFIKSPLGSQTVKMLLRQILRKNQRDKFLFKQLTNTFVRCCPGSVQQLVVEGYCVGVQESLLVSFYAPGINGDVNTTVQVLLAGETVWQDVTDANSITVNNGLGLITGVDVSTFVGKTISVRVLIGNDAESGVTQDIAVVLCT